VRLDSKSTVSAMRLPIKNKEGFGIMWHIKHSCVLLFVLALFIVSPGESLALSTLTTQEMGQITGGCKNCVPNEQCNQTGCDSSPCLTCTEASKHYRCLGPDLDPKCRGRKIASECGVYQYGTCSLHVCNGQTPTQTACGRQECN